jgi:hypothetical protein
VETQIISVAGKLARCSDDRSLLAKAKYATFTIIMESGCEESDYVTQLRSLLNLETGDWHWGVWFLGEDLDCT